MILALAVQVVELPRKSIGAHGIHPLMLAVIRVAVAKCWCRDKGKPLVLQVLSWTLGMDVVELASMTTGHKR